MYHKLTLERLKRGLTQEKLSLEMGVAQNLISAWENNKFFPSMKSIKKISHALKMDYIEAFSLFSPSEVMKNRDLNE